MNGLAALTFAPVVPWTIIIVLAIVAVLLVGFGLVRRARGIAFRAAALTIGLLALTNPVVVEEERTPLADVAVVVVDESPSQEIGQRKAQTARAEAELLAKLEKQPNLDVRVVRAGRVEAQGEQLNDDGTRLFDALNKAITDVPRERFAGAIFLTDGQVHDLPTAEAAKRLGGPVHGLLTGAPNERDRRITLEQAPTYGIVGQEVAITLRVEDNGGGGTATVTLRTEGSEPRRQSVPIGENVDIPFKIEHGGSIFVELEVEAVPNELTLLNNRAVVAINGVRDRLRVLLVTGEPHAGERVWRNLLKADPSVDLVHFTILRPPEKQDGTPIRELSLIAFPIRELFEIKLAEFDLVVFDRYRRRGVLPTNYFQNISNYVKNGGALLEASGPAFANNLSLSRTPLAEVLPGRPTGQTRLEGFRPTVTDLGHRHPVTSELPGSGGMVNGKPGTPTWGRWFQMVDVDATRGQTVLAGHSNRPLLQLDRVGKGRVAQMLSDQAWLWARGYEGGGPQAELLRRTAHWLMKEPDLEEDALIAKVIGGRVEITRRSLEPGNREAAVTKPDGSTETVTLTDGGIGKSVGAFVARSPGLYRLQEGDKAAIAAVGAINPREFADVRATPAVLQPIADATGGSVRYLVDGGVPDIRRTAPERTASGRGWLGLVAHQDYLVAGVRQYPLLPVLAVLLLLLGPLVAAWRREGR